MARIRLQAITLCGRVPPGHGEHFAVEEFALGFGAALDFEVFCLTQPMN
jgi:hypothetical protein